VTVCDNAREACPTYAGAAQQLHGSFDDPAHTPGSDEEKMKVFRCVRDEVKERIQDFLNG
jgi:arsenate reductase